MGQKCILWFRRDLRISDNKLLLNEYCNVLPIFIFDENILSKLPQNDARVSFIFELVARLKQDLKAMNLDLAIIPLADLPFNHYKSSVKWYEMSAMGVPSVVSMVEPYSKEVVDGDNVFGYSDATSFEKSLSLALHSVVLRKKIAKNAYNWVFKHRNAKTNAKLWADAYESLKKS
jgi:deoxyribodipyrimidine photolyase